MDEKIVDIKSLREEFSTLHTKTTELVKKADAEKRDITKDEQSELDKSFARLEQIKKTEELQKKLASMAFANGDVELPKVPAGKEESETIEIKVGDDKSLFSKVGGKAKFNKEVFAGCMKQWAATGVMPEKFATITTATASGALLPRDVSDVVVPSAQNVFREALAVCGLESMKTPTTRDISLPIANTTAGGKVTETANSETENAPSLTPSILLHINNYQSGTTWFSNLEIMANDFDIFAEFLPSLFYAKELAFESDLMSTIVADSNITGQNVATATVSGFTYGNLVALNRALPKRYAQNRVIILSKQAYIAAENLVTTTGFPILNQDAQNSSLKRFNGTPVLWSDYLANFGANNVVGITLSHTGFRIRDAAQDQVQRYPFTSSRPGQVGFNLYGYSCGGYDPAAMALLKCPAS